MWSRAGELILLHTEQMKISAQVLLRRCLARGQLKATVTPLLHLNPLRSKHLESLNSGRQTNVAFPVLDHIWHDLVQPLLRPKAATMWNKEREAWESESKGTRLLQWAENLALGLAQKLAPLLQGPVMSRRGRIFSVTLFCHQIWINPRGFPPAVLSGLLSQTRSQSQVRTTRISQDSAERYCPWVVQKQDMSIKKPWLRASFLHLLTSSSYLAHSTVCAYPQPFWSQRLASSSWGNITGITITLFSSIQVALKTDGKIFLSNSFLTLIYVWNNTNVHKKIKIQI